MDFFEKNICCVRAQPTRVKGRVGQGHNAGQIVANQFRAGETQQTRGTCDIFDIQETKCINNTSYCFFFEKKVAGTQVDIDHFPNAHPIARRNDDGVLVIKQGVLPRETKCII
jgi:hypothetical protein